MGGQTGMPIGGTAGTDGSLLFLEDLSIGQRFASAELPMQAEAIKRFAAEFDPQPIHLDEAAAEAGIFGGLTASGLHTVSVTMKLMVEGGLPLADGVVGLGAEIAWPQPVRPGDVLRVESEIVAVRPSKSRAERGFVKVRSETRNQRGELVQTLLSTVLVAQRGG